MKLRVHMLEWICLSMWLWHLRCDMRTQITILSVIRCSIWEITLVVSHGILLLHIFWNTWIALVSQWHFSCSFISFASITVDSVLHLIISLCCVVALMLHPWLCVWLHVIVRWDWAKVPLGLLHHEWLSLMMYHGLSGCSGCWSVGAIVKGIILCSILWLIRRLSSWFHQVYKGHLRIFVINLIKASMFLYTIKILSIVNVWLILIKRILINSIIKLERIPIWRLTDRNRWRQRSIGIAVSKGTIWWLSILHTCNLSFLHILFVYFDVWWLLIVSVISSAAVRYFLLIFIGITVCILIKSLVCSVDNLDEVAFGVAFVSYYVDLFLLLLVLSRSAVNRMALCICSLTITICIKALKMVHRYAAWYSIDTWRLLIESHSLWCFQRLSRAPLTILLIIINTTHRPNIWQTPLATPIVVLPDVLQLRPSHWLSLRSLLWRPLTSRDAHLISMLRDLLITSVSPGLAQVVLKHIKSLTIGIIIIIIRDVFLGLSFCWFGTIQDFEYFISFLLQLVQLQVRLWVLGQVR